MANLTESQTEAVMHTLGPCRVVAGPGSGKTLVLTRRVARLIGDGIVHPNRCLVITFTKKAAKEMEDRVSATLMGGTNLPWIGTIHSRFLRILREEYGNELGVLDDSNSKKLIRKIQSREALDLSKTWPERDIIMAIDRWRLDCKTPRMVGEELLKSLEKAGIAHMARESLRPMPGRLIERAEVDAATVRQVAHLFYHFQREKRSMNVVDTTDMIYETWRLLSTNTGVRRKWENRFDFILVDEFQDIDACQYAVVMMLAGEKRNLFVVGDDDQAIYGFRGARPELMIDLSDQFPDLRTIVLKDNFRCPKNIVDAANNAIAANGKRIPKTFVGAKDSVEPVFKSVLSKHEAAKFVVDEISALALSGEKLSEIVVIYRVHACSLPFELGLVAKEIPYVVQKGGCFYDIPEVADLLAYFAIATGRYTPEDVLKIYAKPARMAKRSDMMNWKSSSGSINDLGTGKVEYAKPLLRLGEDLISLQQVCRRMSPGQVIETILDYPFWTQSGPVTYRHWARDGDDDLATDTADSDFEKSVEQLLDNAWEFERAEQFMALVSRTRAASRRKDDSTDAVRLCTFHGVKGLEFDHVFLTGMQEGCMPHKKALDNIQQIQEERRLAHVGWTRTKKAVYVVSEVEKENVSRFVLEWMGKTSTTGLSSTSSSKKD